jgi:transcriptional regulator NrdR family protein
VKCPTCGHGEHRILRTKERGSAIRRNRQCDRCGHKWATLEVNENEIAADREKLVRARALAKELGC